MTRVVFSLAIAVTVLLCACKETTDLNSSCALKKKNPDGGSTPVAITEGEVRQNTGYMKDFISRTVDCDKSFCVRDADFVSDAGAEGDAIGYCSAQCDQGVSNSCPSYDGDLDHSAQRLSCRALLLDVETLAALAGGDGGTVGNIREPFFCARGTTPDAG